MVEVSRAVPALKVFANAVAEQTWASKHPSLVLSDSQSISRPLLPRVLTNLTSKTIRAGMASRAHGSGSNDISEWSSGNTVESDASFHLSSAPILFEHTLGMEWLHNLVQRMVLHVHSMLAWSFFSSWSIQYDSWALGLRRWLFCCVIHHYKWQGHGRLCPSDSYGHYAQRFWSRVYSVHCIYSGGSGSALPLHWLPIIDCLLR